MVEYSVQRRNMGLSIREAAIEGAIARFRAILMTSIAFVAGLLPLVVATARVPSATAPSAPLLWGAWWSAHWWDSFSSPAVLYLRLHGRKGEDGEIPARQTIVRTKRPEIQSV
jgi:hypothetical protein